MRTVPYQTIPIKECGEFLIDIPAEPFALTYPHPYVELEAPYGETSPWRLRKRVIDALLRAHDELDVCGQVGG